MQSRIHLASALVVALALAACGAADNPYARFPDPPLVSATLHSVTLAGGADLQEAATSAGWRPARLPPNYQRADQVQAAIWGVPERVAAEAAHFTAPRAGVPDLRVLAMQPGARPAAVDDSIDEAFFRNVLGTAVPAWPLPGAQPDDARVQAWTFRVADIVAASKRLRAHGIPVVYDPVGITTAYLGDHRTLAIRAPDGTVVQLVETRAQ